MGIPAGVVGTALGASTLAGKVGSAQWHGEGVVGDLLLLLLLVGPVLGVLCLQAKNSQFKNNHHGDEARGSRGEEMAPSLLTPAFTLRDYHIPAGFRRAHEPPQATATEDSIYNVDLGLASWRCLWLCCPVR